MGRGTDIQAPLGFDPENDQCRLINKTTFALTKGAIVVIDETIYTSNGAAISATNPSTGLWTCTTSAAPTTAAMADGSIFAFLLDEACAIGATGNFMVNGKCLVQLAASLASVTRRRITATNGAFTGTAAAGVTANNKVIGICMNDNLTGAAAVTLCPTWVDGMNGFLSLGA